MSETVYDSETKTDPSTNSGDHDRFAHYANKNDITFSMVEGKPIMALCGKIWIPSRDPSKYPVCTICKTLFEEYTNG